MVDDAEQQLVLVLEVPVERHRGDAELLGERGLGVVAGQAEQLVGDGGDVGQAEAERAANRAANRLGKLFQYYDEAGRQTLEVYDFKGNVIDLAVGILTLDETLAKKHIDMGATFIAVGTDTNLMAIAAAVIGGTSLFGGRGSAYAALFGMLVLQSITSGLNLIGVEAEVRYIVTGAVLLLAVTIDSLSRRARRSSGTA